MKSGEKLIKLSIKNAYSRPIFGLGEIYEIGSVNWKRLILKNKFGDGTMYLASNKDHSGRGVSLDELKKVVKSESKTILDYGYVDCPPWSSEPRGEANINRVIYNKKMVFLVKIVFQSLFLFEFIFANSRKAHMIYVLAQ
jgi:hypothetical protein